MSIIHFADTAMAAADTGILQYPIGGWNYSHGDGPWGESVQVILYGQGMGVLEGTWEEYDYGILSDSGVFLTDGTDVGNWLVRTIDVTLNSGQIPGQDVTYPGQWLGVRTDWRALGTDAGIVEISVDVTPEWNATSGYTSGTEEVLGLIQFSRYPSNTVDVLFDAADVSTGTDRITITGHGFVVGDQAVYIIPGGESGIQGTDGFDTDIVDNEFLSIEIIDANIIQLGTNLSSVDDTKNLFNITSAGTGTGHILRKIVPATPSVGVEGVDNVIDLYANF